MHSTSHLTSWSPAKKISFRFFFIILTLFIFLNNNGAFLYAEHLFHFPTLWLHKIIPWFSVNVLNYNYDVSIFPNGSGDTSYNYVLLLFIFLLAALGSLIWSILDRKRKNYSKLYYWLIVLVRFYLAFTLMRYGSVKVVQLQFPQPSLLRLLQPLGEMSPMGLAWTFLGFSKGYNIFMGVIEVLSVLLLFKRTMIIGAFLSLAASVHVMAVNYFFDVPVKILSTALVVMGLFILAPYIATILRFFVTYQPQQLSPLQIPVFKRRWQLIAFRSFKYLFIIWTIRLMVSHAFFQQYSFGALAPKSPLYGIYNVEKYILNGKDVLPQHADQNRWKQVVVDWKDYINIRTMDDNKAYFNTTINVKKKQIEINSKNTESTQYKFKYAFTNDSTLIFKGLKDQDSLSITLKKYDLKKITLPNRGFHWINEFPYNR